MSASRGRSSDVCAAGCAAAEAEADGPTTAPSGISPSRSITGGGSAALAFFFLVLRGSVSLVAPDRPRASLTTGMAERSADSRRESWM